MSPGMDWNFRFYAKELLLRLKYLKALNVLALEEGKYFF